MAALAGGAATSALGDVPPGLLALAAAGQAEERVLPSEEGGEMLMEDVASGG